VGTPVVFRAPVVAENVWDVTEVSPAAADGVGSGSLWIWDRFADQPMRAAAFVGDVRERREQVLVWIARLKTMTHPG
jgi:hypothetical protein